MPFYFSLVSPLSFLIFLEQVPNSHLNQLIDPASLLARFPRRPHHDDHLCPGREGLFDALLPIGREDDDSVVTLDALQEMGCLRICVSVMGIVDLTACPEQRVCFIEEEDRATGFRFIEYVIQILLSFADVLAHHRRQIHPE